MPQYLLTRCHILILVNFPGLIRCLNQSLDVDPPPPPQSSWLTVLKVIKATLKDFRPDLKAINCGQWVGSAVK